MINKLSTTTTKLFDVPYLLKFILRLLALYLLFRGINWLMIGIIVPGGYYSPFVDQYLNYVTFVKTSVLQTGGFLGSLFGISSHLVDNSTLRMEDGNSLMMAWSCAGLEILSFWAAFSLADTTPLRSKLLWCVGGLLTIWFINCARVALLIVAIYQDWQIIPRLKHHDTFNIVAYSFVFLLMYVYYNKNKKQLGA